MKQIYFPLSFVLTASCLAVAATPARAGHGDYEVPGLRDLGGYARFDLDHFEMHEEAGAVQLAYDLPTLLVGPNPPRIRLSGRAVEGAIFFELIGENATASCHYTGTGIVCLVQHRAINIDIAKRDDLIVAASANATVFAARRAVAVAFGSEPIGVVTYTDDDDDDRAPLPVSATRN